MKNKTKWIRHSLQIFFFVLIGMFAINHIIGETGTAPFSFLPNVSLHAICPFGGIESALSLITAGALTRQLQLSTLVMTGIIIIMTLIFGAVFCSFVCPLGSIQEWIGKLGKKIFKKKYNTFIPTKVHNILKYFRYVSLIAVVVLTYKAATLIFLEVDPYFAMYNFFTDEVTIGSLIVLGVTLVGSLFVERPWCKYACPYGAFLGLVGKISIFKIKRNTETCTSCNLCNKKCPMNIDIQNKKVVYDGLCNKCLECTDSGVCKPNSLSYQAGKVKEAKDENQ